MGSAGKDSKNDVKEDNQKEDKNFIALVDHIWASYDKDQSGTLDLEETKKFMEDYLQSIGMADYEDAEKGTDLEVNNEEVITHMFRQCDKDGSGEIDKKEMIKLIKGFN